MSNISLKNIMNEVLKEDQPKLDPQVIRSLLMSVGIHDIKDIRKSEDMDGYHIDLKNDYKDLMGKAYYLKTKGYNVISKGKNSLMISNNQY